MKIKKFFVLLIVSTIFVLSGFGVHADDLSASLRAISDTEIEVTVENQTEQSLKNLEYQLELSNDYVIEESIPGTAELKAGEKNVFSVKVKKSKIASLLNKVLPNTGDRSTYLWFGLAAIPLACVAFFAFKSRHKSTGIVIFLLSVGFATYPVMANTVQKFEHSQNITLGQDTVKAKLLVKYEKKEILKSKQETPSTQPSKTINTDTPKVDELKLEVYRGLEKLSVAWEYRDGFVYTVEKGTSESDLKVISDKQATAFYVENDENKEIIYLKVSEYDGSGQLTRASKVQEIKIMVDTDKDGLSDEDESEFKTDKNKPDTDKDQVTDFQEVKIYHTNPLKADSDEDGLTDYDEIGMKLDPNKADSDENGISDAEEDIDKDGISNAEEMKQGTIPLAPDSDFDGLTDVQEKELGTKPMELDSDGDDVADGEEVAYKTDPLKKDGDKKVTVTVEAYNENPTAVVKPQVEVTVSAKNARFVEAERIDVSEVLSTEQPEAILSDVYDFTSEEKFDSAKVTFTLDRTKISAEAQPKLYYINEKSKKLEEVADQKIEGDNLIANLEHFSKYIVIDLNVIGVDYKTTIEAKWLTFKTATANNDVTDRELAILAQMSYYNLNKMSDAESVISNQSEKELLKEIKNYEIVTDKLLPKEFRILFPNGGFAAVVYKNGNNVVLAYRGTDEIFGADGGDHIGFAISRGIYNTLDIFRINIAESHFQDSSARKMLSNVVHRYAKEDAYLTGHSLGGRLALIGNNEQFGTVKKTITFNALGVDKEDYKNAYKNNINYIIEGEVLNQMLQSPKENLKFIPYNPSNKNKLLAKYVWFWDQIEGIKRHFMENFFFAEEFKSLKKIPDKGSNTNEDSNIDLGIIKIVDDLSKLTASEIEEIRQVAMDAYLKKPFIWGVKREEWFTFQEGYQSYSVGKFDMGLIVDYYNSRKAETYNLEDVLDDLGTKKSEADSLKFKKDSRLSSEITQDEMRRLLGEEPSFSLVYFEGDGQLVASLPATGFEAVGMVADESQWQKSKDKIVVPIVTPRKTVAEVEIRVNNKKYKGGRQRSRVYAEKVVDAQSANRERLTPDQRQSYKAVLDDYKIKINDKNYQPNNASYYHPAVVLRNYHNGQLKYALSDLNSDGVQELLIGSESDSQSEDVLDAYSIYAVFTHDGSKAVDLFNNEIPFGLRPGLNIFKDGTMQVHWGSSAWESSEMSYKINSSNNGLDMFFAYSVTYPRNSSGMTPDEINAAAVYEILESRNGGVTDSEGKTGVFATGEKFSEVDFWSQYGQYKKYLRDFGNTEVAEGLDLELVIYDSSNF